MRIVGMAGIIVGACSGVFSTVNLVYVAGLPGLAGTIGIAVMLVAILVSLLSIATGVWTLRAAQSFQRVVDTREADIHHLMSAMRELDKVYFVQMIFAAATLIFVALGLVSLFFRASGG